jgi:hypothetical protein
MEARCGGTVARGIVTVLLLLAVSPVTAPFLTFDARNLPGEQAPLGTAVVQAKKAHDEPVSAFVSGPALPLAASAISRAIVPHLVQRPRRGPVFAPLRI